jgi:hypothetical protein
VSDKVINTGLTVEALSAFLAKIPPTTEVYVETEDTMDIVGGAIYFPRHNIVSLIGQKTEIEVDPEDWDSIQHVGDIGFYDPSDQASDSDETHTVEVGLGIESEARVAPKVGEVDAPVRERKTA